MHPQVHRVRSTHLYIYDQVHHFPNPNPNPMHPQVHRFRNMFSHWDDNGDGAISYPEFVAVMKVVTERQGRPYSEKKVQAMFGLADLDRNGVVDFEEFVVMQAR